MQCPHCKDHFNEQHGKYCPHCGVALNEDPFAEIPNNPALHRSQESSGGPTKKAASPHRKPAQGHGNPSAQGSKKSSDPTGDKSVELTLDEPERLEKVEAHNQWVKQCIELVQQEIPEIAIALHRPIQKGTQVKFEWNGDQATVNFYVTGTVYPSGSPSSDLVNRLKGIAWPAFTGKEQPKGGINRTFLILDVNEDSLRHALAHISDLAIREEPAEDYIRFSWSLIRGGQFLRLRAYYTEKVTLQGKRSDWSHEVERALEDEMARSHLEYRKPPALRPLPKYHTDQGAELVKAHIGMSAWELLTDRSKSALAYAWTQIVQAPPEGPKDTSFLLAACILPLEEFIIEFALSIGIGNPVGEDDKNQVGNWIREFENTCRSRNDTSGLKLAKRFKEAWHQRHKYAHVDRRDRPPTDQRACREQFYTWLDLMRDSMKWREARGH
jgi:hypothetical protein